MLNKYIKGKTKLDIDSLLTKFSHKVLEEYLKCDYTDAAYSVLERLHKKKKLYVVSGGNEIELKTVFKEKEIDGFFHNICGSPTNKSTIIQRIVANGCKDKVLVIGDNLGDMEAANKNGIDLICTKKYSMCHEEIQKKVSVIKINTLKDLTNIY